MCVLCTERPNRDNSQAELVLGADSLVWTPHCLQLLYRLPLEEVRERTLQVTVWNYNTFEENEFLGAMHLRIAELDLSKETTGWFQLQTLHKITT